MPRNAQFHSKREPLRDHPDVELLLSHVTGPFTFLNPTRAAFRHNQFLDEEPEDQGPKEHDRLSPGQKGNQVTRGGAALADIDFLWRARDNRKGRHALRVSQGPEAVLRRNVPALTSGLRATGQGILRMFTVYPVWDVSYLVAMMFTFGSVVWVINAFFVWLPLVKPETEFPEEILVGGGITAFIGATIFEIGSILLMLEAVNEERSGCFGWAVEKAIEGHHSSGKGVNIEPRLQECRHHHANKRNFVGRSHQQAKAASEGLDTASSSEKTWQWFPSIVGLRMHYLHELGFLASFFQFLGATIFWISGFTALPGILDHLSQTLLDCIYWLPQIIGGSGFIVSGILFMLETQRKWYQPAFSVLGWHIGFWNLVGAIGFTLCGALGPAYANSGAQYQASLATFWGSWAFLIGSVVQWYESLDKFPVEAK
jgi:hypothetical protein